MKTINLPQQFITNDGTINRLVDQTDEWLAGYILDLRNAQYISYAEWRAQGRNLMEPGTCTDEQFDEWVNLKVTTLIDSMEIILQERAAAIEAAAKQPHLTVVK